MWRTHGANTKSTHSSSDLTSRTAQQERIHMNVKRKRTIWHAEWAALSHTIAQQRSFSLFSRLPFSQCHWFWFDSRAIAFYSTLCAVNVPRSTLRKLIQHMRQMSFARKRLEQTELHENEWTMSCTVARLSTIYGCVFEQFLETFRENVFRMLLYKTTAHWITLDFDEMFI